jgi:hypothetical protein
MRARSPLSGGLLWPHESKSQARETEHLLEASVSAPQWQGKNALCSSNTTGSIYTHHSWYRVSAAGLVSRAAGHVRVFSR